MSWAEFDQYVDERQAKGDDTPVPVMFGEWMADLSGNAVIGGPVDEPPEFIALPSLSD